MKIEATGYNINVSESELFDLAFHLIDVLKQQDKYDHSAKFDGMKTYESNYSRAMLMLETFSRYLARPDLYDDTMRQVQEGIDLAIKARSKK